MTYVIMVIGFLNVQAKLKKLKNSNTLTSHREQHRNDSNNMLIKISESCYFVEKKERGAIKGKKIEKREKYSK